MNARHKKVCSFSRRRISFIVCPHKNTKTLSWANHKLPYSSLQKNHIIDNMRRILTPKSKKSFFDLLSFFLKEGSERKKGRKRSCLWFMNIWIVYNCAGMCVTESERFMVIVIFSFSMNFFLSALINLKFISSNISHALFNSFRQSVPS